MMFRAPIIYNSDLNTRVQKPPVSLLWGQSEELSASAAGSWGICVAGNPIATSGLRRRSRQGPRL